MPKRIKQEDRPTDVNQLAHHLVNISTGTQEAPNPLAPVSVSQYLATIGRKGGKIGGKRRMETMTAKERSRVAAKAAKTRWKNAKKKY
jgi:hypothetical protein